MVSWKQSNKKWISVISKLEKARHYSSDFIKNRAIEGAKLFDKIMKEYAIPVAGVIVTGGAGILTIHTAHIQANATIDAASIQADATLRAAAQSTEQSFPDIFDEKRVPGSSDDSRLKGESQNFVIGYLNLVSELSDGKKVTPAGGELLEAKTFTYFRNLDGEGKGQLVRFLAEYDLIKVNQPEISLSGADLRKINVTDAWLPDIDLTGAFMTGGEFINADLENVNLSDADLFDANLANANLTGANLTNANLVGANLTNANLTGANLTGTNLMDANLCNATLPDRTISVQGCP
jgi:uncharacterized protein YjbI with pentapeptide repeats